MVKTSKLDDPFTFFYVTKIVTQAALIAGTPDVKKETPVGEYHIIYRGRLICGDSREVIKNREKGTPKDAKERPHGIKCCRVCDEGWRKNPDSKYYQFVNGKPPKILPDASATTTYGVKSKVRE